MAKVPGKKELSNFLWDPFSRVLASHINLWTSFIPPPPRHPDDPPRKVLMVHAHPCGTKSFNGACYEKAKAGLIAAGHEVRPISLYDENFWPAISPDELRSYMTPLDKRDPKLAESTKVLQKHTELLLWCDSIVLVYPTFWYSPPAMLKGWIDRVFLPNTTWVLPSPTTPPPSVVGLVPLLHNITKVGVVTTYGSSFKVIRYVGDPGRRIISRGLRPLFNSKCTLLWTGMYGADEADQAKREKFLQHVEEAYSEF